MDVVQYSLSIIDQKVRNTRKFISPQTAAAMSLLVLGSRRNQRLMIREELLPGCSTD